MGFESWAERDVVMMLDFDSQVVGLSSQPFWLHWQDGGLRRRHAPDFFARLADGSGVVVDVRPDELIDDQAAEAFAATARACDDAGWLFRRSGRLAPALAANSGARYSRRSVSWRDWMESEIWRMS